MNKQDYISELDSLHASSNLKKSIADIGAVQPKKKHNVKKSVGIIAACLAAVIVISGFFGTALSAEKDMGLVVDFASSSNGSFDTVYSNSETADEASDVSNSLQADSQKIIKTASIYMQTKEIDELLKKINTEISSLKGYTSSYSQDKYNESGSVNAIVQIPAEKLDGFIEFLDKAGTVTSKQISTKSITEIYTETESKIKAYETEEKTLLGILEKCESVTDIITVQERLSEIRSELETLNNTKKLYDSQISYSSVELSISEVDRVKKASNSFGSEIWEKFKDNLYNIGHFFRNLAVFVLSASPYLVVIAVAAIIVALIIKKKRGRN